MNVGELFVNLGVKGSDQALRATEGISKGMKEVTSTSLETKAAIVAVLYGLERLTSAAGARGMALEQFAASTGLSADQLQRWQYAARQFGVGGEEVVGTAKSIQAAMTNMLLGKGAPEGMTLLSRTVGFDKSRARDTFYVLEQLQKFAKQAPPDIANFVLKSFGAGDNMQQFLRRNNVDLKKVGRNNIYSGGELDQLQKVGVAWANISAKIEMALGHLTAEHGVKILNDLSQITSEVIRLSETLIKLAEKMEVFKALDDIIVGWKGIGDIMNGDPDAVLKAAGFSKEEIARRKKAAQTVEAGSGDLSKDPNWAPPKNKFETMWDHLFTPKQNTVIPPRLQNQNGKQQAPTQNINVNQNLNFQHDGKDATQTGKSVHHAIKGAFRQSPAQGQVA